MINIPVSAGELFDKLSILCIKLDKIKDDNKLKLVNKELEELILICDVVAHKHKHSVKELEKLQSELLIVNTELWDIEDDIRIKEKNKEFDKEFIELARSVYITNDKRFELKAKINELLGSNIKEVKSYEDYNDNFEDEYENQPFAD